MSTNDSFEGKVQPVAEDRHGEMLLEQKFEQARQYALNRLEKELSSNLLYHGLAHTREDVVPSAEKLAGLEGIQGASLYLLLTAAWFHDLGYIEQPDHHELTSANIAFQVLPTFGFSPHQVKIVQQAIYATILPQSPKTHLDKILADADLNVLGRIDFLLRNDYLRCERAHFGVVYTDVEWYSGQLKFLEAHSFFTKSANALYNAQKLNNIDTLRNILEGVTAKR